MAAILITAGTKRIGLALTDYFAARGWRVFAHCRRRDDNSEKVVADLVARGGRVEVVVADLADSAAAGRLVDECFAADDLRAVINNASVFEYDCPAAVDRRILDTAMAVNLVAPVTIAERFRTRIGDRGGDHCLINILDNKVFALNPDFFSYTLSKSALLAATEMMAMAYAPHLRVCGIAPGLTLISGRQTAEDFAAVHACTPLGRGCGVEDIARTAAFILDSPILTGQVIALDGGQRLMRLPRDVAFLTPDPGADDDGQ